MNRASNKHFILFLANGNGTFRERLETSKVRIKDKTILLERHLELSGLNPMSKIVEKIRSTGEGETSHDPQNVAYIELYLMAKDPGSIHKAGQEHGLGTMRRSPNNPVNETYLCLRYSFDQLESDVVMLDAAQNSWAFQQFKFTNVRLDQSLCLERTSRETGNKWSLVQRIVSGLNAMGRSMNQQVGTGDHRPVSRLGDVFSDPDEEASE